MLFICSRYFWTGRTCQKFCNFPLNVGLKLFVKAKVTSCLGYKWYIQHAFQDNSLENVHVCTHITFEIIVNLKFWSKKVRIELSQYKCLQCSFTENIIGALQTTIVQAKRPQKKIPLKLKQTFFQKMSRNSNIYIQIRTVTRIKCTWTIDISSRC